MNNVIRAEQKFGVKQGGQAGAPDAVFTSGGGGPYDPGMEARVALLERGIEDIRVGLLRIEKGQSDLAKELTDLRRELKERDIPGISAQLSGLQSGLAEKPRTSGIYRVVVAIFGFVLALLAAIVSGVWFFKKIGVI